MCVHSLSPNPGVSVQWAWWCGKAAHRLNVIDCLWGVLDLTLWSETKKLVSDTKEYKKITQLWRKSPWKFYNCFGFWLQSSWLLWVKKVFPLSNLRLVLTMQHLQIFHSHRACFMIFEINVRVSYGSCNKSSYSIKPTEDCLADLLVLTNSVYPHTYWGQPQTY